MRALCREAYAEHPLPDRDAWESCVRELWDARRTARSGTPRSPWPRHRFYRAHQRPGHLDLYRHLVVTGAWWDLVDSLASHNVGELLAAHPAEVTPVLRAWAVDDDLWLRRTAMLCQLGRKDDTDVDLLRDALEPNLEDSRARPGVLRPQGARLGAARSTPGPTPTGCAAFVAEHDDRLSGLSRREALKHL